MRRLLQVSCGICFMIAVALVLSGCTKPPAGAKDESAKKDKKDKKEHDHAKHGPHNGPFAEWDKVDGEELHAEIIVDPATKQVTVYVLDEHVKESPTKFEPKQFSSVKVRVTKPEPKFDVELAYDAEKSKEKKGFAFVGKHDRFGEKGIDFQGVIDADVEVKGKKQGVSGEFPNTGYKKPEKSAKLRELYLKPGGIYTAADIQKNGSTTPAEKFAGKIWEHPEKKVGDKVCPVTDNRAEAECYWFVNGERYEFCCTPCVDKFIKQAHNEPSKIKPAKEYVYAGK